MISNETDASSPEKSKNTSRRRNISIRMSLAPLLACVGFYLGGEAIDFNADAQKTTAVQLDACVKSQKPTQRLTDVDIDCFIGIEGTENLLWGVRNFTTSDTVQDVLQYSGNLRDRADNIHWHEIIAILGTTTMGWFVGKNTLTVDYSVNDRL